MSGRGLRRAAIVWVALLALTVIGVAVGGEHGAASPATRVGVVVALTLGAAKAVAIALEFMELDVAPALLRRLVLGWIAVAWTAIVALYLAG